MGGFRPSRADIAGSTIVGSDKDLDTHAFTGSVDITGSLTLNGASVAPGGTPGGATTQIQYNDSGAFAGSANLTFDGSNLKTTGSLYISSSAAGNNVPLLRIDHPGSRDDNPILFVTGSGFVGIGVLEPTYLLQVASSQAGAPGGTTRAFLVQDDAGSEWFSVNGGTIAFNTGGGSTRAGGVDLGQRFNISPISSSAASPPGALALGKYPLSPANIFEVNSANTDEGGDFFVIDSDGKVGINTGTPVEALDVADDTDASARIGRAHIGYNGTNSDEAIFAHRDRANSGDYALLQRGDGTTILNTIAGGTLYVRTGGNSPALIVAGAHNNNIGINTTSPTARLHISASAVENDVLRVDGPGTNLHALYVSGSGHVGIGTGTPIQTLSVSGSAAFSGSFGSTAIENRSTDLGVLSATDGVSIIDLTAAATNTDFTFSIADGTFTGQQKTVYFKTIIGLGGATSNSANLQGTNIDSTIGIPAGSIKLSGSDPGFGWQGQQRGGAVLLWDGTNWAPISVTNAFWT